ncbi:MAG: glutaminyl-peptide cyclotransferase [Proteobacteria bacterium]|nr:glutaminyl-peptide cyclotransferase [Pseudomonadota bacterium]
MAAVIAILVSIIPAPLSAGSSSALIQPEPPQNQLRRAYESRAPVYGFEIVSTYPHDPGAFTQGLVYEEDHFYEGTGLRGQSSLRRVMLANGQVLQQHDLEDSLFGEGVAVVDDQIIQLTWKSNVGFVYDKSSFEVQQQFQYAHEGWGITYDGERLIVSDGTATLYFWDPETLQEIGKVAVHDDLGPVVRLNELEFIDGEVFANIWLTDLIARIDPGSGRIVGYIDLSGLLPPEDHTPSTNVLNGIAYDATLDRLFVTGKRWPKLFHIDLVAPTYKTYLNRLINEHCTNVRHATYTAFHLLNLPSLTICGRLQAEQSPSSAE